jgi:hypothetical protein
LQASSGTRQRRFRHDNWPGWPAANNWGNTEPKKARDSITQSFFGCTTPNQREPESSKSLLSFLSHLRIPPVSFVVRFFLGFIISSINSDHVVRDGDVKVKDSKALAVISTTRKKKKKPLVELSTPNGCHPIDYTTSYFYYWILIRCGAVRRPVA